MIDEKKIEEAAHRYCKETGCTQEVSLLITEVFTEGARWAIDEFLKDLWHPASEEPKGYNDQILLQYIGNYYSIHRVADFVSWKGFVKSCPIDKWLYIDDLLKGGKK